MRPSYLLLLLAGLILSTTSAPLPEPEIPLNFGSPLRQNLTSNWIFQQISNFTWYSAQVPGTVHLDLLNHQIIPDPYLEANILTVQWVELADFLYFTNFTLSDPNILKYDVVELVFEGLDTTPPSTSTTASSSKPTTCSAPGKST